MNVKKPTIIGILTFISMINTYRRDTKQETSFVGILVFMSSWNFMLSWGEQWEKFYNLGPGSFECPQHMYWFRKKKNWFGNFTLKHPSNLEKWISILTLYAPMDSSFRFDRVNLEWSIVYIERLHVPISKYSCISFSKDHFILANSVDPDEMPQYI